MKTESSKMDRISCRSIQVDGQRNCIVKNGIVWTSFLGYESEGYTTRQSATGADVGFFLPILG